MSRKARPAKPGTQMTPEIEAMIRVDHAGEYGAVRVVSGNIAGKTQTMPLRVESLNDEFQGAAAFAVASLLALLALVTLAFKTFLEWRQHREFELAQQASVSESGETQFIAKGKSE